jgi:hypothetical protein
MVDGMGGVPLIKDNGETSNAENIGRKVRAVSALRAFSGSFALERRAQDDSKNKQRRSTRTNKSEMRGFFPFGKLRVRMTINLGGAIAARLKPCPSVLASACG